MRLYLEDGTHIDATQLHIGCCNKCPNLHIKFVDDDGDVMAVIDVLPTEVDRLIAGMIEARNNMNMRPVKLPPTPTHMGPGTPQ